MYVPETLSLVGNNKYAIFLFPPGLVDHQFSASKQISAPLTSLIISQSKEFSIPSLQSIKCEIRQTKQQLLNTQSDNIKSSSDPLLQRTIDMLSAKCSSLWLTALPIQEQGFYLHKEFQDALRMRYGWELARVQATMFVVLPLVWIML